MTPNTECADCFEPATHMLETYYDGPIYLCHECYEKCMSGPDEPDYDAPTAREEQLRTYEQKYYGKGL
jgi:hypothetical protein